VAAHKSAIMVKVAVIIKHVFRDYDYRVDLYDVPKEKTINQLREEIEKKLLGPFEIVSMTDRITEHGF
jgi:hypothetical protein